MNAMTETCLLLEYRPKNVVANSGDNEDKIVDILTFLHQKLL